MLPLYTNLICAEFPFKLDYYDLFSMSYYPSNAEVLTLLGT